MISVLIPAYNCRPWIEESLRSIIGQSHPAEEILVADDASTDETAEFVESLGLPGVRLLRSERNQGISTQLNRMIDEAKGRHIARMDGDDIAHPDRFRLQLEAISRTDTGVMGAWSRRFGASNTTHRFPDSDALLKGGLLFSVPFCHPTVFIDRDRVKCPLRYDPEYDLAEDYELWTRMRKSVRYGNVPGVLLDWRMHNRNAGTSPTTAPRQRELSTRIRLHLLGEYGITLTDEQFAILNQRALSIVLDGSSLRSYLDVLSMISSTDPAVMDTTREARTTVLLEQWDLACAFTAWKEPSTPGVWASGRRKLGGAIRPEVALKLHVKAWLGRRRNKAH